MRINNTRIIVSLSLLCFLAGSAWAGGIKHPSNYGDPPNAITFEPCTTASQTVDGVIASCFQGTGGSPFDFLFTLALVTPSASTSITSVTFNLSDIADLDSADPFGLLEGDTADCAAMNIACTPAQITINDGSPLALGANTFTFTHFTGDLVATAYFGYDNTADAPSFTGAVLSGATTSTPEPSEIGVLIAAFGSLIFIRRKQLAKQNG